MKDLILRGLVQRLLTNIFTTLLSRPALRRIGEEGGRNAGS